MFTVWSFGEGLRAQVSFSTGCVRVSELCYVMRITPILVKDALRHAFREKLCFAGVWAAVTRSACKSNEVRGIREERVVCGSSQ